MAESYKILYCAVSDYKPRQGGIAEMTHQIAIHLRKSGHVPHVVGLDEPGAADFDRTAGYPVTRLSSDRKTWFNELKKISDTLELDFIIVNVMGSAFRECHKLARKLKIPLALFVYGTDVTMISRPLEKFKVKLSLSWADGVFACSDFTRQYLPRLGVHKEHAYTMYTGIDPQYADRYPGDDEYVNQFAAPGKKLVVTLCRLTKRKGMDLAVEAVGLLSKKRSDFVHVIAGSGTEEPALRAQVAALGLEEVVKFAGEVNDSQKHALYRRMDVYLMPNRQLPNGDVEGFGTTFLEANIYGKPVIGGKSGGTQEAIEDGYSGYLVEAGDAEGIAQRLNSLFNKPWLAESLGSQGRKRAVTQFSYTHLVKGFVANLQSIKEGKS